MRAYVKFRAEIRFASEGVTVYAEVETALVDGTPVPSRVRLLAPPSLAGIELSREDGEIVLIRDDIRTPSVGAQRWWEMAALLCVSGKLRYVCDVEWAGLSLEYAESDAGHEVYREAVTGIPKRICMGERELTVIRFVRTPARS